jgi:hypothetical protein
MERGFNGFHRGTDVVVVCNIQEDGNDLAVLAAAALVRLGHLPDGDRYGVATGGKIVRSGAADPLTTTGN